MVLMTGKKEQAYYALLWTDFLALLIPSRRALLRSQSLLSSGTEPIQPLDRMVDCFQHHCMGNFRIFHPLPEYPSLLPQVPDLRTNLGGTASHWILASRSQLPLPPLGPLR